MRHVLLTLLLAVPLAAATAAAAEPSGRGGKNEWSFNLFAVGSKSYQFEGGATARNDGGAGFGVSLARNLNDYFALGAEVSLAQFNYRSNVAPAAGNAGAAFETKGKMETGGLRLYGTWNLLASRVTPFLTAGAGVSFLDTNLSEEPRADACWIYPWYGQVCGDKAPKNTLTRLNYGTALGMRVDLRDGMGYYRAQVGGEWLAISEALSPVGYVQFRIDFGLRF